MEQAKILKLLGYKMGKFQLTILCQRSNKGKFNETEAGRLFCLGEPEDKMDE